MSFGIPPLLGNIANITNKISLLESDFSLLMGSSTPQWGIFNSGTSTLAVTPDSTVSFAIKREFNIMDYPIESGSFSNYNKIQRPYSIDIRMICGGSISKRTNFLQQVAAMQQSTQLFDVWIPEGIYSNNSCISYDYSKTATNGVSLIIVDIKMQHVIQTATSTYNNTQKPSDSDPVSSGQLSTQVAGSVTASTIQQTLSKIPNFAVGK